MVRVERLPAACRLVAPLEPAHQDGDHPGVGPQPVARAEDDVQLGRPAWPLGQGPGVGHGDVGVVGTVDHEERPALESAASSAGWRTESSLAQASIEAGNPGVVMTPCAGSARGGPRDPGPQSRRSAGVPRHATPPPARRRRPGAGRARRRSRSRRRGGATTRGSRSRPGRSGRPASPAPRSRPPTRRRRADAAVTTRQPDSRVSRSARAG